MESPNPIASLGLRFDNVKIALETLCATADLLELTTDAADISEPLRAAIAQIRSLELGNATDATHLFLDFYQALTPSLQKVISDAFNHENNALLIELSAAVPDAVKEMLTISGLGPKRLREVWQTMGIQNEAQLYQATLENRLLHAKGFGPKTQAKIQQTLVARRKNGQAFFFYGP